MQQQFFIGGNASISHRSVDTDAFETIDQLKYDVGKAFSFADSKGKYFPSKYDYS